MEDRILLLDGEDKVTLKEFIEANTAEDVVPLNDNEIEALKAMSVDDEIYIGIALIKRIK